MRKRVLSIIAAMFLFAGLSLPAFAEDYIPQVGLEKELARAREKTEWINSHTPQEIAEAEGFPNEWLVISPYGTSEPPEPKLVVEENMAWEDVIAMLFEKYSIGDEQTITLGYYNPETGEEKYYLGDTYKISASMLKVPLNMLYTEKISKGEMSFEQDIYGRPYSTMLYRTIVKSDNDCSGQLIGYLGGYSTFREAQKVYLGGNPTEEEGYLYSDNYYTARQFIQVLKLLYTENDRFPGVVENMLEAEPYSYLREYEHRFPIAQKYGYVEQSNHTYINSCGIVFSASPFCIVIFTDNLSKAYDVMAEYCTLMCDYNEIQSRKAQEAAAQAEQERLAAEAAAQAEAEAEAAEAAARVQEEASVQEEPSKQEEPNAADERPVLVKHTIGNVPIGGFMAMIAICTAAIIAIVIIFRYNGAGSINGFWGVLSIILAALAMLLCIVGLNFGTIVSAPNGNPQDTVEAFYENIISGNYSEAYSYLSDYSDLGLENPPESEEGRMIFNALKSSYAYTIRGNCTRDTLHATQLVAFRYLNLAMVEEAAGGMINDLLNDVVQTRPKSQVYDAEGNYLESVTDEVYRKALTEVLGDSEKYCTSSEFEVSLDYIDGEWLLNTDSRMIAALLGGAA